MKDNESFWLIAPYAAWMVLMMCLPSAPWAYVTRTLVTLALLVPAVLRRGKDSAAPVDGTKTAGDAESFPLRHAGFGVLVGVIVFAIWILPDQFEWYRHYCVIGDPYSSLSPLSLSSPLTWLQLFGSAFVIATAEELFFRKWLIGYAGFWWMVGLFAIEHNRPVVAAICGVLYGFLYLKKGLLAAIVTHITTNLLLGLFVLHYNRWEFW